MSGCHTKISGSPLYVQMNHDLSFCCFCNGSDKKGTRFLHTNGLKSHLRWHIESGIDMSGALEYVEQMEEDWKKQVKVRGGVG